MSETSSFDIVRNGYDPGQFSRKINAMQSQIDSLNDLVMTYKGQIEKVSAQFRTLRDRYQELVSELTMREKAADDVTRLALREANSVIENAQRNADAIIEEALFKAKSLLAETESYNDESNRRKGELKAHLEQFIETLNGCEAPEAPDLDSLVKKITSEE